jgi:hypothetical protein
VAREFNLSQEMARDSVQQCTPQPPYPSAQQAGP